MKLVPKKYEKFIYEKVLPVVGCFLINAIFSTIKIRWLNDTFLFECKRKRKPVIFAVWHNRLAYVGYGYTHVYNRNPRERNLVSIVSRSKDGRVFGGIMERMGLRAAYGSSSRGGESALREMIRLVKEENLDCGITPDGPRGPKYKVQPGVISIAQATDAVIIPLSCDYKHKIRLKSWDGFYIPLPFTKGVVCYGEPIYVPSGISDEERKEYQVKLKNELTAVCGIVKNYIKNGAEPSV